MNKHNQYDIFISYRREGGYDTAQLLYDRLTQMCYRVSFDLETLRGGKFNTQLYKRIEQCSDVLVIMSRDSLNFRENPEDDWFRLEIAHALKHKKNIVPVFLRDFKFPQKGDLPPDIADLVDYQGVTASQEHFDSVLQRICRNFKAKPVRKRWPAIAAVALAVIVVAGIGVWSNADRLLPYPFTQEQKRQVEVFAANIMLVGAAYNEYLLAEGDLLDAAGRSVSAKSRKAFDDAAVQFSYRLKRVRDQYAAASAATSDFAKRFGGMPIDYAGMQVFLEGLRQELQLADDEIPSLERICEPKNPCETEDRLRMLDYKRRDHGIRSELFSVNVMGLFCKISPEALMDFKKIAVEWTKLGLLSDPWLRDEKEIERKLEALCNKLESVIGEMQTILGTQNAVLAGDMKRFREMATEMGVTPEQMEKMLAADQAIANIKTAMDVSKAMPERELELYRKQLLELGATSEQAEEHVGKLRKVLELKKKLAEDQEDLAEAQDRLRKKFAPKDDDDVGMLWGKALRFMSVKMPEDAKLCIDALRKRNTPEFPAAALDVAEAIFLSNDDVPFHGGVLVCGYGPPATSHAIYNIGDVITKVNGKPCIRYEDYRAKAGDKYTIYRRNAKGEFVELTATMPDGQPRVALVDLVE